jgi:LysR family cys regulon transcriptional activator
VATTHTVARYMLPKVIQGFIKRYPNVQLVLKQGDPELICELVDIGEADLAIGTETIQAFPNLIRLPCFEITRSIIAKVGHPLLSTKRLTLENVAAFPIILYDGRYSSRRKVMNAFTKAGIVPNIVLSAVDADVSKTYVEMGLGIAILAAKAFDPAHDTGLRARDASHLFESSTLFVTLRANTYLRLFVVDFIKSIAPQLTAEAIQASLQAGLDSIKR